MGDRAEKRQPGGGEMDKTSRTQCCSIAVARVSKYMNADMNAEKRDLTSGNG